MSGEEFTTMMVVCFGPMALGLIVALFTHPAVFVLGIMLGFVGLGILYLVWKKQGKL